MVNLHLQVQHPSTSSILLQCAVNKENPCTGYAKEKLRTSKVNSLTGKGKENATRNVAVNQKCIARGVSVGSRVKSQRTAECNHLQKGDAARSTTLTIVVL